MFEKFFPDESVSSTYEIDFQNLYGEGYRGILFDIDNTLVEHGKGANRRAMELFRRLREMGFECCLISNNKKQRVSSFNEHIGVHTVFNAHKPSRKGYYEAMELMGTKRENTLFIGDQLFTDIWGAKRCGIRNILVKPIDKHEEIQIVIKRWFEKIILKEYRQKKAAKKRERKEEAGVRRCNRNFFRRFGKKYYVLKK